MTRPNAKELVRFALHHGTEKELRAVIDKLFYVVDYRAQEALARIVRNQQVNLDLRVELAGRLSGDVALAQCLTTEPEILAAVRNNGFASDHLVEHTHVVAEQGWANVFTTDYLFSSRLDWDLVERHLSNNDQYGDEYSTEEILDRLGIRFYTVNKEKRAILTRTLKLVLARAQKISEKDIMSYVPFEEFLEAIMSRRDLPLSVLDYLRAHPPVGRKIPVEWFAISDNATVDFLSDLAWDRTKEERARLTQLIIEKYIYSAS